VKADKLSDKDRRSEARHSIDDKTLEELRKGNQRPPSPQPSEQEAPPASAMPQQQGNGMRQQYTQPTQRMEPEERPDPNAFRMPGSAGDQIAQAAQGAGRFRAGNGGGTGYGIGPVDRNARMGNLDILSDTQGVDFGPYLSRALQSIKNNWYNLIPEEARAPLMKHGKVTIRFLIMANGKVGGLFIETPSGDIPLDRAAYGGITGSDPFSPLPHEFHGPYLALRIRFYYNPSTGEMETDSN
jgi:TonB family protein